MRHILITGATGGLGQALALAYAEPQTLLTLTGRNQEMLEQLRHKCEEKGTRLQTQVLDLQDGAEIGRWVRQMDLQYPVDLVLANAGVSSSVGMQDEAEDILDMRRSFSINTLAAVETVLPLAERMRCRRNGQIALVSSLAGWRGMPSSPAYSASKAAVRTYGQALRAWLAPYQVKVSVISPGFVDTPMSRRYQGAKPFLISAEKAARIIKTGLQKNKPEITFPLILGLGIKMLDLLPARTGDFILRRFFRFYVHPEDR